MSEQANPYTTGEMPPLPKVPWATMITSVLILVVFAGLVAVVLMVGNVPSNAPSGVNQLQELRVRERDILDNYAYDPQTKAFSIPIDRAMTILADEGKAKGELQSFPAKPKAKMDAKKAD